MGRRSPRPGRFRCKVSPRSAPEIIGEHIGKTLEGEKEADSLVQMTFVESDIEKKDRVQGWRWLERREAASVTSVNSKQVT